MTRRLTSIVLCAGVVLCGAAAYGARDGTGIIDVTAVIDADSVTVGERFHIVHTFTFPDSLEMVTPKASPPGKTMVVDSSWRDAKPREGTVERTRDTVAMTLDLAQALLPAEVVSFVSASGDTLEVAVDEVMVPVRHLAAQSKDLRPLKEQWEAPRSYTGWIIGAAAALVLAALAWFLWRRRRRVEPAPEPRIVLPPDHVALAELLRIERLGMLEQRDFKPYYTLVVDAVRHYIESRFGVEAMDRTTRELLDDMRPRADVVGLEALLVEADLVKFAKFVPTRDAGERAMVTARDIVVKTTPVATTAAEAAEGTG